MEVIADQVKLKEDIIFKSIVDNLSNTFRSDDVLAYYNYTLYCADSPDNFVKAKLLLVSPEFGVVFIIDKSEISDYVVYFENLYSNLYKKFIGQQELRKNRVTLAFDIIGLVKSSSSGIDEENDIKLVAISDIVKEICDHKLEKKLNDEQYKLILSCIDNTAKMLAKRQRQVPSAPSGDEKKKGEILNLIQDKITCLDKEQRKVAMNCIDSPQRIRGLAGSGKTILLTLKAAYYHLSNPDADILYTYYTKDLYDLIKRLIEKFFRDIADNNEPNWEKIHILHAWGGYQLEGVYSTVCADLHESPINFQTAAFHNYKNPFAYVCGQILQQDIKPKYDLTLIDEGQDFPNEFYRLCYKLTKNRRIVWAYDEFQNIFDVDLQDEKNTFGTDREGNYNIDFKRLENQDQDVILHCCYRTPKEILIAAFSLGMGIYNKQILQRLETKEHWESLGFTVESGTCQDGERMLISRSKDNTPISMTDDFDKGSMIFRAFNSIEEECLFITKEIENDIKVEGLQPEDICVICLNNNLVKRYYSILFSNLYDKGINTFNMLNAANANRRFSYDKCVTLATVNKAKGNECGMVYIVGANSVFNDNNDVIQRNRLFTAMTRSKGWVTISGIGNDIMGKGRMELKKLIEKDLKLDFIQPSEKQTRTVMEGSIAKHSEFEEFKRKYEDLLKTGMSKQEILNYINDNE